MSKKKLNKIVQGLAIHCGGGWNRAVVFPLSQDQSQVVLKHVDHFIKMVEDQIEIETEDTELEEHSQVPSVKVAGTKLEITQRGLTRWRLRNLEWS